MYFIVVKFQVKPEYVDSWVERVTPFTEATRSEPGNIFFEWSRSVDDSSEFVLVEAFTDDGAGPHVNSEHFKTFVAETPEALAATPRIISRQVDGDGWGPMGEMSVD